MNTDQTREDIWQAALNYRHTVASEYRLKDALARHEAAIKVEAWDEGARHGYEDARGYHVFGSGCGPDYHDCTCPNPYQEATE